MRSRLAAAALMLAAATSAVAPAGAQARRPSIFESAPLPAVELGADPLRADVPFHPSSPWNSPIPPAPALDPRSHAIVRHLSSGRHPAIANIGAYGVPVYEADASTPRYDVRCDRPWGLCDLEREGVPIPLNAVPSGGSDAAMVVIDRSAGKVYEFWRAHRVGDGWRTSWGGVADLHGEGTPGAAVGAGVSRLAGVVRVEEIAAGEIGHALVFATDNACAERHRYPASKTDGSSQRWNCIPEGARIQLDPSIDVETLPGLTPGERVVARALQDYGAYAIDNGAARMAFIFEVPTDGSQVYRDAGFEWDFFGLDAIPWSSLRVLSSWNGS